MASQVTDYKCPACAGPLHFVGASGRLECDYCGSKYAVAEIEAMFAGKEEAAKGAFREAGEKAVRESASGGGEWDTSGIDSDWGQDGKGMKAYDCPSCGAQMICDATTAATSCPYCGSNTVVPGQFDGTLKPDYILPFKMDKAAAEEALKRHYKGKFFLPRAFTSQNHIEEIKGVYVPFWLFDGKAFGGAEYHTTRDHRRRQEDEEIVTTEHFRVIREGELSFEKVPVDASEKMPDDYMDSIEPYDYRDLKPFSTAYLPGYLADKYDVTVQQSKKRADDRCRNTFLRALEDTVQGYDSCSRERQSVNLERGKVHYALMPVWMLNSKWEGRDYLFAMNGQTGKLVGDLPMSWGKFWLTFAAIAAPLAVVMGIITFLL